MRARSPALILEAFAVFAQTCHQDTRAFHCQLTALHCPFCFFFAIFTVHDCGSDLHLCNEHAPKSALRITDDLDIHQLSNLRLKIVIRRA